MDTWDEIRRLQGRRLATLGRWKPFDVVKVGERAVEIVIGSTGSARRVSRREIERAWRELEGRRSLSLPRIRGGHSYVAAMLSELPGVTHRRHPIRLRLTRRSSRRPS